ncbi:MAG TPA: ribosome biogenesis GTPase Der, partial [Planctomycetaceae bacterium]|nr:ribosome biogenesis GTPase Der [Planctomycetaceae bacterium]
RPELLDAIIEHLSFEPDAQEDQPAPVMKLAIVGKRNAGKSTLVNALAKEDRMIVSEVPGTTRDSVDVRFERDGQTFIAIDTAGIIKKGKARTSVEFYSLARAQRSIRRCDVAMLVLDAPREITQVDKSVAEYTREQYKPCVIVVNKWDLALARGIQTEAFVRYIRSHLTSLSYAPIAFVSAAKRTNLGPTIRLAQDLFRQSRTRITTADVNAAIEKATAARKPPMRRNREAKIYYATQVDIAPPTFTLFVNYTECFTPRYLRFLENNFRKAFPFSEIPVRFIIRPSHAEEGARR